MQFLHPQSPSSSSIESLLTLLQPSDCKMNNSPDSKQVTKSNLRDPVTALPPEVLCYLFFSLGPFSIAASRAVSSAWRDVVLSDSALHREIDLTKVESRWEVMHHLVRLQSLSQNKLSKVSLNVSSFWSAWIWQDGEEFDCEDEEDYTPASLESLLEELQVSSGSLKEVSLEVCESDELKDLFYDEEEAPDSRDALPFLSVILRDLFDGAKFSSLKRISMKGPTYFEVEAGEDVPGSKHFSLQDTSESLEKQGMEDDWYLEQTQQMDQSRLGSARLALMKKIKEFTGSGLIKFGGGGSWVFREQHSAIMEELWLSSSTLQIIHLQVFDFTRGPLRDEMWSRAVNCPTLSRFRLVGHKEIEDEHSDYGYEVWDSDPLSERKEIEEELEFSRDSKKLKIKLQIPTIAWEAIADLVGNDLKEFRFIFDWMFSGSSGRIAGLDSFVFRFQGSLKFLELRDIYFLNEKVDSLQGSSFPNLNTLILSDVDDSVLEVFSKISSPRLRFLSINSGESRPPINSKCILSLLKLHSSKLIRLHFRASWRLVDEGTNSELSFSKLKYLKFSSKTSQNASASAFFLQFTYPNLIKIEPASLEECFSKVAPKLVQTKKEVETG